MHKILIISNKEWNYFLEENGVLLLQGEPDLEDMLMSLKIHGAMFIIGVLLFIK